jgi:hypothetical protein
MSGSPDTNLSYYIISSCWNLTYINDINENIDLIAIGNKYLVDAIPDYKFGMYSNDMIPFLYDGFGNYVCVKNLPDDESLWTILKTGGIGQCFININHFLLTSIECYEREAYFWDEEDNSWDCDSDFEDEILEEVKQRLEAL